jgi:hypothetical protein
MTARDWYLVFVTRVKHEELYIREWLEEEPMLHSAQSGGRCR